MPAREPTYYRWAEDKPCTTNQTYGFELRHTDAGNGCVRCNACKVGAAEAAAAAAAAAKREDRRQQVQQRETAGNRRDGSSASCYSTKVQCKPINKGYTVGHVPITKRLKAAAGGRRQRGADGTTVSSSEEQQQPNGKDLYLWHALSGTLVYCKNDEEFNA